MRSTATAHSDCTAKCENKANYNTDSIFAELINLYYDDWNEIKTQIEKGKIYICKRYCTD